MADLFEEYQGGASLWVLAAKYGITPSSVYARVKRRADRLGVCLRGRLRRYRPWVGVEVEVGIIDQVRSGEMSKRRAASLVCCSRRTIARRAAEAGISE